VSFTYIHIINQFKVSEDLEVYEFDYEDNYILQETCDVLQPVIFQRYEKMVLPCFENYKQILNLKDASDYYRESVCFDSIQSIELPCKSLIELFDTDTVGHYFTEGNQSFIDEIGLLKQISNLDKELKPNFTFKSYYDFIMGSLNTCTPLRFHKSTRKYLYVVNGSISIKMCSYKFTKYLHLIKDYELLDFRSPVNPWLYEQLSNQYKTDLENIQFIDFIVPEGHILYIPRYWWYSIKFTEKNTNIIEYNYSTFVNSISHIDDIGKNYLQNQNIITYYKNKKTLLQEPGIVTNEVVNDDKNEITEEILKS
jgi:hypothetical protein